MRNKLLKENLIDVNMHLNRFDIPHFLIGGTLLGAVRDKNILEWEKDIDLGIFTNHCDYLSNIYNALKQLEILGFTVTKFFPTCITLDRGIRVDLFAFFKGADGYYCRLGDYQLTYPFECLNSLDKIDLYGNKYSIPHNSELFLSTQYGENWKIPNKNFNILNCPNIRNLKNDK